ncbi:MAG: S9 family peptidase [Bacteroidetes bacterium]|nr:MAG: S9 family peptidase [Bacteroidota bacterium]
MKTYYNLSYAAVVASILVLSSCSQPEKGISLEDYQRAEQFLSANTSKLVYGVVSGQNWQADESLIYKNSVSGGAEYILANPTSGDQARAFDHQKLADTLADESDEELDPNDLSLSSLKISADGQSLAFNFNSKRYEVDLTDYALTALASRQMRNENLSPDGTKAVYIKDYNLWVRNTTNDSRHQLTFDGKEDFGYATNNAGWTKRDSPVLLWAPDSKKIATFQHDGRGVGEMYLWSTKVGHPKLEQWKYPLPGDSLIFRIERVVIHLNPQPKLVRLKMPVDAHRSTISDHVAGRGGDFLDVEWGQDSESLAFVSSSRDHKIAELKVANIYNGKVRDILKEEVATYFESGNNKVNWHVLPESNEAIWFSERSDWGHLYLYDLQSGELKHQITTGEWAVLQLLHIDRENRMLYFTGSNKEVGDPYFQYLYSINFDGSELTNLTPEDANHRIILSESRQFFTDSYSTPTTPPITVIRDLNGEVKMTLQVGDITDLIANGWVPPIPFTVKARDNITDLYGLMYKPTNFDASKKYPILNYLYPGPQSGSVGSRSFRTSRSDKQSLAELGFIVVEVDAMGSPGRSKSFHDAYYGNMGDNGLPDQISMIKQLAAENTWMDIDKVGIWGHSGGGFASTDGILRYPEFYKVAVSGAGNHDNRNYEDDWGEKWQGLLVKEENKTTGTEGVNIDMEVPKGKEVTNYDNQANQLLAGNLQGKLLIAHGMMDGNVHPSNTMLVVDALIKADKDFDMLVFPNSRHGFGNSRYFLKRRWDYFVTHLKGETPPEGFMFNENIR